MCHVTWLPLPVSLPNVYISLLKQTGNNLTKDDEEELKEKLQGIEKLKI